jgi:hypothetical protein
MDDLIRKYLGNKMADIEAWRYFYGIFEELCCFLYNIAIRKQELKMSKTAKTE